MIRKLRTIGTADAVVLALVSIGAVHGFEWVLVHGAQLEPVNSASRVALSALLFLALVHQVTRGRVR